MNQSITRLTLDVSVQEKQASISVRQFDTMRRLVFSMVDRGLPYTFENGVYAAISVNTSPETAVFGGCVIKDGAVHYDLDNSLTLEPAEYSCDLILYASDHKVLTASSFDLIVFASNASDYASEAVLSNDFSAMVEATAEAKDAAADALEAANTARDVADLANDAREDADAAAGRAFALSQTLEDKLAAGEFQGEKGDTGAQGPQGIQGEKAKRVTRATRAIRATKANRASKVSKAKRATKAIRAKTASPSPKSKAPTKSRKTPPTDCISKRAAHLLRVAARLSTITTALIPYLPTCPKDRLWLCRVLLSR